MANPLRNIRAISGLVAAVFLMLIIITALAVGMLITIYQTRLHNAQVQAEQLNIQRNQEQINVTASQEYAYFRNGGEKAVTVKYIVYKDATITFQPVEHVIAPGEIYAVPRNATETGIITALGNYFSITQTTQTAQSYAVEIVASEDFWIGASTTTEKNTPHDSDAFLHVKLDYAEVRRVRRACLYFDYLLPPAEQVMQAYLVLHLVSVEPPSPLFIGGMLEYLPENSTWISCYWYWEQVFPEGWWVEDTFYEDEGETVSIDVTPIIQQANPFEKGVTLLIRFQNETPARAYHFDFYSSEAAEHLRPKLVIFYRPASFLAGWSYRKFHILNVSREYTAPITVHYTSGVDSGQDVYVNAHCRTDFGDIRFTASDGITELSYWMEEKVDGDYAKFWVKMLPANKTVIYIYYGNEYATTTSDGKNTFPVFYDFSIDESSDWIVDSGNFAWDPENGWVIATAQGASLMRLANYNITAGYAARGKVKASISGAYYFRGGLFLAYHDSDNWYACYIQAKGPAPGYYYPDHTGYGFAKNVDGNWTFTLGQELIFSNVWFTLEARWISVDNVTCWISTEHIFYLQPLENWTQGGVGLYAWIDDDYSGSVLYWDYFLIREYYPDIEARIHTDFYSLEECLVGGEV